MEDASAHEPWHARWRENRLGWHEPRPNPLLVRHWASLGLKPGARVFLPLCGKTLDIHWLLDQGYEVVGAELSPLAIDQLFEELGLKPEIAPAGKLERRTAGRLTVFVGDVFELDRATLGPVAAVYDRAAFVALPGATRVVYVPHVRTVAKTPPQLLITFDYDQSKLEPPPFSIADSEVQALYGTEYEISLLETAEVEGGLKGVCPAVEKVWRMSPR